MLRREHALEVHQTQGNRIHRLLSPRSSSNTPCIKCSSPLASLDHRSLLERSADEAQKLRRLISRIRLLKRRRQKSWSEAVERMKAMVVIKSKEAGRHLNRSACSKHGLHSAVWAAPSSKTVQVGMIQSGNVVARQQGANGESSVAGGVGCKDMQG